MAFLKTLILVMGLAAAGQFLQASEPVMVVPLWPDGAPGEKGDVGPEADTTKASDNLIGGRRLIRLGKVSNPTIAMYRPSPDKDTGAAVLVCPGGGYHILAMDLEGTEVCEWLNSIGVTGVLLKYRVPRRNGLEKHTAAAQDAQRALGLVRSRAGELGLDPKRIGVLGFSAGGHLGAWLSNNYERRTYDKVDAADDVSCRPDFAVLIYPGYLTVKEDNDKVAPDLTLTSNTPPTFIVMAQDDPVRVENALGYACGMAKVKAPFELHVYPTGGHGYGLRASEHEVTTWPARAGDWMRKLRVLERK